MAYNPFSLEGKTILVTGASSGIGRGIAVECSKMGATMVINGRNQKRLNETLSMLEGEGHMIIQADLSKQEDIDNIFHKDSLTAISALISLIISWAVLKIISKKIKKSPVKIIE